GNDVFFADIWPSTEEVNEVLNKVVTRELFQKEYKTVFTANEKWNAIETSTESLYTFDDKSTYIQNPPFFTGLSKEPEAIKGLDNLRVIAKFGDSITTDHISPAGAI
ncbi:aconitate hydratase, partial [Butyricicoccus sp. 1XD8-22]